MVAEVDSSFKFFGFLAGNLIVNASRNCLKTKNQAGICKDLFHNHSLSLLTSYQN